MTEKEQILHLYKQLEEVHFNSIDPVFKSFYSRLLSIQKVYEIRSIFLLNGDITDAKNSETAIKYQRTSLSQQEFKNEEELFIDLFNIIEYAYSSGVTRLINTIVGGSSKGSERIQQFYEEYLVPFLNILINKIIDSNSEYILLHRFAKRCEWFRKRELNDLYLSGKENRDYEKRLENEIRLYLFDNGHEFPLSNPVSSSGRIDIVSFHKVNKAFAIEVKIYDEQKGYKINKINEGFRQAYQYAHDYGTENAFLCVFVFDDIRLSLSDEAGNKISYLSINGKNLYLISIYVSEATASGKKSISALTINEKDIRKEIDG